VHPDPVLAQDLRDRGDLAQPVGQQVRLGGVHVDVVDRDRVDPDARQEPCVCAQPRHVPARRAVPPEQRASRVAALDLAHDGVYRHVVPVVEHAPAQRGAVMLHRPVRAERRLAEPDQVVEAVQEPGRRIGHQSRDPVAAGQGETLRIARPGRGPARHREHQVGAVGRPVPPAPTVPHRAAVPSAGDRHLVQDGRHQQPLAVHDGVPGAERAERLVR
jgi:hypothetical protein